MKNLHYRLWPEEEGGRAAFPLDYFSAAGHDPIQEAHIWLPDGALVLPRGRAQTCGRERASGVYTTAAQDAKLEIFG